MVPFSTKVLQVTFLECMQFFLPYTGEMSNRDFSGAIIPCVFKSKSADKYVGLLEEYMGTSMSYKKDKKRKDRNQADAEKRSKAFQALEAITNASAILAQAASEKKRAEDSEGFTRFNGCKLLGRKPPSSKF